MTTMRRGTRALALMTERATAVRAAVEVHIADPAARNRNAIQKMFQKLRSKRIGKVIGRHLPEPL